MLFSGMKSTFYSTTSETLMREASKYLIIIVFWMRSSQHPHLIYIFLCSAQVHNEFSFSSIYQSYRHDSRGEKKMPAIHARMASLEK